MNKLIIAIIFTITILLGANQFVNAVSFLPLGHPPGDFGRSQGNGMSNDGIAIVGISNSLTIEFKEAFRWTADEGMIPLGHLPGSGPFSIGEAVSNGGLVVVGSDIPPIGNPRAFKWTVENGIEGLGFLPGKEGFELSAAHDVSDDGSVIVGASSSTDSMGNEGFRWTESEGMVGLGFLPGGTATSNAQGISADGTVIAGAAETFSGSVAARWTEADGWVSLGILPGYISSFGTNISADGSTVVGLNSPGLSGSEAFRWTESEGMIGLGFLPDRNISTAQAVSGDGSIVVGNAGDTHSGQDVAFIWDETNGIRDLNDVLIEEGVELGEFTLTHAFGISADGKKIAGNTVSPSHPNRQPFLVDFGTSPPTVIVGGEILSVDSSSLLLAGAQSFSWMIPVVLSILGIGLFVASRKSE